MSAPFAPVTGFAVFAMGIQTVVGNRGVGQVTLLVPASAPQFIEWTGVESPAGAAITSGFSAAAGTHIVYLDFAHTVDLEVHSATAVRVHNSGGGAATGSVTFVW